MFWLIVDRILRKRRNELIVTGVLGIAAIGFLAWAQALGASGFWGTFFEKVFFALLVSIFVRWITVWFAEVEGFDRTSHTELFDAIRSARTRVWISQTYLPGTELDAERILKSKADSIRLLLASHKTGSPIHARLAGRGMSPDTGKAFARGSVVPFAKAKDPRVTIRFCFGHHPGWIALVDSFVFAGATPVDRDNWSAEFLFKRVRSGSEEGIFWEKQFELLWSADNSHAYQDEQQGPNPTLPDLSHG